MFFLTPKKDSGPLRKDSGLEPSKPPPSSAFDAGVHRNSSSSTIEEEDDAVVYLDCDWPNGSHSTTSIVFVQPMKNCANSQRPHTPFFLAQPEGSHHNILQFTTKN